MPIPTRPLSQPAVCIWLAWGFAALVTASPFRAAAHLAPAALLIFYLATCGRDSRIRLIRRLGLVAAIGVVWVLAGRSFNPAVTWQSILLSTVTWSSLVALLLPMDAKDGLRAIPRIEVTSLWLLGAQGVWGLVQMAYGGLREGTLDSTTGDYVDGFVHPSLEAAGTFANPTFSAGLSVLLLISLGAYMRSGERRFLLGSCFAAFVVSVASVLHQIAFLTLTMILAVMLLTLFHRGFKKASAVLIVVAVLVGTTVLLHPRNTRAGARQAARVSWSVVSAGKYAKDGQSPSWEGGPQGDTSTVADAYASMSMAERGELSKHIYESPNAKLTLFYSVIDEASENTGALLVGWGPGTFGSRAAAIQTGLYFGSPQAPRQIPGLRPEISPLFEEHVLHPWLRVTFAGANFGSTHKPFSSWISALSEMGAVGLVVLVVLGFATTRALAAASACQWVSFVLAGVVGVFLCLGFQEHYWEMPQIALLFLLTIRIYFAVSDGERRDGRSPVAQVDGAGR